MTPEPVTPPESDLGRRAQSIYDLEKTLVGFLSRLFDSYRLDNPTLNLAQVTGPELLEPQIVKDPDDPPVSYDPTERAETLFLKVPPRVERGRVPRNVTGEIMVDKLPDFPSITVQVIAVTIDTDVTTATVQMFFHAYDENPESGGYQDCQNMAEAASIALGSFGQQAIDKAYPIIMPIEWKLITADTFPHYIAEMTTKWEMPSPRPLPDSEIFGIVPGEHLEFRASENGALGKFEL